MRSHEGFDILVDGQPRTFRDVKSVAYEAAAYLKLGRNGGQKFETVDRATEHRAEMFADGRVV